MNKDLSDKKATGNLKHFKRYGILLLVLTIIGTATLTIETTAHCVSIIKDYIVFSDSEDTDIDESINIFSSLELPISKDNLDELNSLEEYSTSDAKEFGFVTTMIHQNNHYTVQLWDNDADGYYDEKRIFSIFTPSDIKESDFDKIKKGISTDELFKIIPISQMTDYSYIITADGYEENIDLYAEGEEIQYEYPAHLFIICKNGIITELDYSPASDEFEE